MYIDPDNVDKTLEMSIIQHAQNSVRLVMMKNGSLEHTEKEFKDLAKETEAIENEVVDFLKQRPREMVKMLLSLNLRLYIQEEKISIFIKKLTEATSSVKEKPHVKKS